MPASEVARARGAVGHAVRRRDTEGEAVARRNLAAVKLAVHVERALAETPLDDEQRARIVALLTA